ncbi:hypothetical protein GF380_05445 [Candidatus Uhrbacteria bacterium]|nr:hypothetical protein [Candidatus Uhrbacteria bacterium]MBD3284475.1 hypothetical protein [Candidatus Uhrbacteria bacterium]
MNDRFLLILLTFVLLGAGCFGFGKQNDAPGEPTAEAIEDAFEHSSTTFGMAPTNTDALLVEPPRWDVEEIYSKHIAFDPPAGYWVYLSEFDRSYWIVPGTPPDVGSEDPGPEIEASRIATMYPVNYDPESFPTWERFKLTMSQFQCVDGTGPEDIVGCLDEPLNVKRGKTVTGLPYESYTLQLIRKKDQAAMGVRKFIMVRMGEANSNGVLIVIDPEQDALGPALELATSMRVNIGEES